jgi:hypothetical protein
MQITPIMSKAQHSKSVVLAVLVFLHFPFLLGVLAALLAPFFDDKSNIIIKITVFSFGIFAMFIFCGIAHVSWKWWKSLPDGK